MKKAAYEQDMTHGSPFRLIVAFALPLLIGNLFQQLYNLVDTMVVGHYLGDNAIAAIGATAALYSLIINFACDLNNGYGIVVTQCFGAGDPRGMKKAIAGMLVLNTGAGLVLFSLSLAFLRPLITFMNTPEGIFSQAYQYIAIICAGIPITIAYNMFAAILRAVGNSRTPLYFLMLASVLNIVLDLLLVAVFRLGITGAALATVAAQLIAATLSGLYVWRHYRRYLPEREDFRVPKAMYGKLLAMGTTLAFTSCVVEIGTVIFQRSANLLGEGLIAAHSSARRILMMGLQPILSLAVANMTFMGQNWGAKKPERIRQAVRTVFGMEVTWCCLATLAVFLFGEGMIRFLTGTQSQTMLDNAVLSLRIHFSLLPVLGVLFCLRSTMQAIGKKAISVFSSVIELCMKLFSVYALIPQLGFLGVCITEPITWVFMTLFLGISYLLGSKKWFAAVMQPQEA